MNLRTYESQKKLSCLDSYISYILSFVVSQFLRFKTCTFHFIKNPSFEVFLLFNFLSLLVS